MNRLRGIAPERLASLAIAVVSVALVVMAYLPAMSAPFFFDDDPAIVENRSIRSLWPPSEAMAPPPNTPLIGRPLANFSFAINYAFGGLHVEGYHAVNLALHLLLGALLWSASRTLLSRVIVPAWLRERAGTVSLVATLLWLVHPLNSEVVIYTTQRTDQLAALSWLGTIVLAMRGFESPRPFVWYLAAFVADLLGIGCKEWAATVCLVVLVVDRGFFSPSWREVWARRRWFHASLTCVLGLAALFIFFSPYSSQSLLPETTVTSTRWLATQAGVVVHYLRLAIWPAPLSISYHWPIADSLLTHWPQGLLLCALLGSTLVALARAPWLALPGVILFTVLGPSSSFVPLVTEVVAERRMYMPLAALIVTAIALVTRAVVFVRERAGTSSSAVRALTTVSVCALLATCVVRTRARAHDYRDRASIWGAAVQAQSSDPQARHGLIRALIAAGRVDEAKPHAVRLAGMAANLHSGQSWPAIGYIMLGEIAEKDDRAAQALAHYASAVRLAPALAEARFHRGMLLLRRGELEMALEDFGRAMEDPSSTIRAMAHSNAGLAYMQLGQRSLAIEQFLAAVDLNPDNAGVWSNLSLAFAQQGQLDLAKAALAAALRIEPNDPSLLRNAKALQQHRARNRPSP